MERDNLFGLGEAFSFNYNQDTANHNGLKNSEVYSGNFSVPFGYWTFSQNASHSEYLQTITGTNQSFQASGETDTSTSKLERVIYRSQNSKASINTALKLKDTKAFIEDVSSTSGTYKLTMLDFGTDYTLRAMNAIWSIGATYERGIDAFGAKKDTAAITEDTPHAQFDKYSLDASFYKPFAVKNASLGWRSSIFGQYSGDTLFSSERISIGDRYTVRGFAEDSMIGDSGIYNRNELMWNLPQFTENKYANFVIGNLQPYIGLDMGTARMQGGKAASGGTGAGYLSGLAGGIRNNGEFFSFDIAYAQAIKSPVFIDKKPNEIYFNVSTKIGF